MTFAEVPTESRSRIRQAGDLLKGGWSDDWGHESIERWLEALELAGRWRACHAYPINTFQKSLRDKLRHIGGDPIAAQRLKRMPTIVNKLQRYPAMNLTTMQDIAGVRGIVESIEHVYALWDEYRNSTRMAHELIEQRDYIANPRSEDGYRSVHLIYKYNNKKAPSYKGLRVELQLRTRLQHIWATAVETMGTFLGQALKSRQGDQEWLDFFAIVSSAFAHKEGTAPVPRFAHLSASDTLKALTAAEHNMNALTMMEGVSGAVEQMTARDAGGKTSFYHLVVLDSVNHTVTIKPYGRDELEKATLDYTEIEAQAAKSQRGIEPVLVSAGPIEKLRRAYSSFFLDIHEFQRIVSEMIHPAA